MKARERVLGELHFECRASHSKNIVGPADNGTRRFYYDWHVPVCLVLGWWFEVCFHRSQEILWKGVEGTRGMNNKMWRYRLIPGRCSGIPERCRGEGLRWCGDPHAHFTNWCGCRQCKSGKNRLILSEDLEQVARVSVHCKLSTRATQVNVYRRRRAGVKGSLFSVGAQTSVSDPMMGKELLGVNDEDCCYFRHHS